MLFTARPRTCAQGGLDRSSIFHLYAPHRPITPSFHSLNKILKLFHAGTGSLAHSTASANLTHESSWVPKVHENSLITLDTLVCPVRTTRFVTLQCLFHCVLEAYPWRTVIFECLERNELNQDLQQCFSHIPSLLRPACIAQFPCPKLSLDRDFGAGAAGSVSPCTASFDEVIISISQQPHWPYSLE